MVYSRFVLYFIAYYIVSPIGKVLIKDIIIYGKDYLSFVIFKKHWNRISKTTIIEMGDTERQWIKEYALSIANKLSPHILTMNKPTRNVFQNSVDVDQIHKCIVNDL